MLTWWRCGDRGIDPGSPAADLTEVLDRLSGDEFAWVALTDPDPAQQADLERGLRLPRFAVHDALAAHPRPKLDSYDGVVGVVVKTVWYLSDTTAVETGDITMLVADRLLVTLRHGEHDPLPLVREKLTEHPRPLRAGTRGLAYAVVDTIVDEYLAASEQIAADVTTVEREVFSPGRINRVEQLYSLQREVLEFRAAVEPMDGVATDLLSHHDRHDPIVPFLRRLAHRVKRVEDTVTRSDTLLNAILQAHLGQIAMWQNEDMRKISAWAAIIAAPTLIAGVYGMNFKYMPELDWVVSYPLVLLLMLALCWLLHRGFKRNGWL